MIAVSVHFNKRKIILVLVALILIIAVVTITIRGIGKSQKNAENDYSNNYNRIGYLNLCGWDVSETPVSESTVTIPTNFNECYNNYNQIQLKQGFDLSKHKGQNAQRFTYNVSNYAKKDKIVMAELLVYDGQIIAGSIYENQQNGFQCGLNETP